MGSTSPDVDVWSVSPLALERLGGRLPEHDVAAVRRAHLRDVLLVLLGGALEILLEARDLLRERGDRILEREHVLDAREAQTELAREALDAGEPLEVGIRVEARAARRAPRPHEAPSLVQPQRLRVHADEGRGDPDHVLGGLGGHAAPATATPAFRSSSSRGFGPLRSASLSSTSRCAFVSFFGTTILTRARRLPLRSPSPAIGAPRPLPRSITPSLVPAGTFSRTDSPSGVGTSIVAPEAASTKSTGTSTMTSSPRRVKIGDASTETCTKRSPNGPP